MNKAVGLKYNKDLPAPFVIAKAQGALAERLKKIANENNVPVIKNDFLSENLFIVEPGKYIPEDVFEIVAEILVFIKETQDLV